MIWHSSTYLYYNLVKIGKNNYEEIVEAIDYMNLGISALQEVGNQYVDSGHFNESHFEYGDQLFQKGSRQFNYRIYMFETRVVNVPLEVINKRLEEFKLLNRTLQATYDNVQVKIQQLSSLFHDSINNIWQHIYDLTAHAIQYMNDIEMLKTPLSEEVTSAELEEKIRRLSVFFNDVRSRVRELQDGIMNLKVAYHNVWTAMLAEDSTKEFYKMLYYDCQDFLTTSNQTAYDEYIAIFR